MGRIKHVDVTDMWVQEVFNNKRAFLHKVPGTENPADVLTKYTDHNMLNMALDKMNLHSIEGRSSVAPAPMGVATNPTTAQ